MNNKLELKNIIIFTSILLVFTLLYIVIDKNINKENDYVEYVKNYKVNEYIPTYVSDNDMAKIYLNDYIYIMYSNVERAYNLLDEEYRNLKFGNIDNYKNYIKSLTYSTYELDRFYVKDKDGYRIFGVYDKHGNTFIFKTQGVMQYAVYLDDYTVEI